MFMVAFMYPAGPNGDFDYEHFTQVHLPMGLGLTKKHLGITPKKIIVFNPIVTGEGDLAPYAAISNVLFETEQEAQTFCSLFTFEEAARRLSDDFANYTSGAPEVILAEVKELTHIDEMIAAFEANEAA